MLKLVCKCGSEKFSVSLNEEDESANVLCLSCGEVRCLNNFVVKIKKVKKDVLQKKDSRKPTIPTGNNGLPSGTRGETKTSSS